MELVPIFQIEILILRLVISLTERAQKDAVNILISFSDGEEGWCSVPYHELQQALCKAVLENNTVCEYKMLVEAISHLYEEGLIKMEFMCGTVYLTPTDDLQKRFS